MCERVTFVVFTDGENCRRPISTNTGSMEAGENGLMRGTCFVARCLEVVAVAGLMWISWCVLGRAGFFVFVFFDFFFLGTHTACCKYEAALPHLSLLVLTLIPISSPPAAIGGSSLGSVAVALGASEKSCY